LNTGLVQHNEHQITGWPILETLKKQKKLSPVIKWSPVIECPVLLTCKRVIKKIFILFLQWSSLVDHSITGKIVWISKSGLSLNRSLDNRNLPDIGCSLYIFGPPLYYLSWI
jgi:hypothetical protein